MAKTFRRKTGRKTRSNKKSNRRTRRKVGGSRLKALLVSLAALAPKAAAVPAASYHDKPVIIKVGNIDLPATPNGSGYNIKKDVIRDKLGEDTLNELKMLDNSWFSSQNDVSISTSDIKKYNEKYNLKTIRDDITPKEAESAAENYAPHGRLW